MALFFLLFKALEKVLFCLYVEEMSYKIIKSREVRRVAESIEPNIKKSVLLSGSWKGPYAIAAIVVDNIMPKAEVHKKHVDVWRIVKGEGKFILGGSLVNPEQVAENELVGDSIKGGKKVVVKEGDLVDIPPGIPHQIDARGKRLEMTILKILI